MNYSDINALINSLYFSCDTFHYCTNKIVLLCEGSTDKTLLDRIKQKFDIKNLKIITTKKAFENAEVYRDNSKLLVGDTILAIEKYNNLFKIPNGINNNKLYGIIDKDYGVDSKYKGLNQLLYNDTHDIETMMLSTDNGLISRLDDYAPDSNTLKHIYKFSYELGLIKNVLENEKLDMRGGRISLDKEMYLSISSANDLDITKYVKFLNNSEYNKKRMSKKDLEKIISKIKTAIKKYYKNECWNLNEYDFKEKLPNDFWQIVNGHDVCSLIRILNTNKQSIEENECGDSINRDVEIELAEKYDIECFKKSSLYKKFVELEIIDIQ